MAIGLSMIIATELFHEMVTGGRAVEGLSIDGFAEGDLYFSSNHSVIYKVRMFRNSSVRVSR